MNGIAEMFVKFIKEIARPIHLNSQLPAELWGHSVLHAAYIKNHWPVSSNNNLSAVELFHGFKPKINHILTYGCKVSVPIYLKRNRGGTFAPICQDRIYVGTHSPSIIKVLDPVTARLSYCRLVDCQYYEDVFPPLHGKQWSNFYWDNEDLPQNLTRTGNPHDEPSASQLVISTLRRDARVRLDPVAEILNSKSGKSSYSPLTEPAGPVKDINTYKQLKRIRADVCVHFVLNLTIIRELQFNIVVLYCTG
jgi:hypothetical protein